MRIRQTAGNRHPALSQKTPDAPGWTLPDMNINLATFGLNQSSCVCLPVFSDDVRLIWGLLNQTELPLKGAEALGKAFNRLPYLTQKETNALAHRCSLHPDEVRVWFMVQRLRYGISWDCKDIMVVQSKLKSNQAKEEPQKGVKKEMKADNGEKKTGKRKVAVLGNVGKKVKGESQKGMRERGNQQMERKMKLEKQVQKEKDKKVGNDKKNTQQKRKRGTETGKMGGKRMKQGDGDRFAAEGDQEDVETERQKSVQQETNERNKKAKENKRFLSGQEWPHCKSFGEPKLSNTDPSSIQRKTKTGATLEGEVYAGSAIINDDDGKLKKLIGVNYYPIAEHPVADASILSPKVRCHAKTQAQLAMLRVAFVQCQYPDKDDYDQLSVLIGIPRHQLVQWFGDTRYYIKKGRPGWLSLGQHSQVLANIMLRQYLKEKPFQSSKRIIWETTLGGSGDKSRLRLPEAE